MTCKFTDFHRLDPALLNYDALSDEDKYSSLVSWAGSARGINPEVFDRLTEWVLDDLQWTEDKLLSSKKMLIEDVIEVFKKQNSVLSEILCALEPSGLVNPAVFGALERFDKALSGETGFDDIDSAVSALFSNDGGLLDCSVRAKIAGGKTGSAGTDTVDYFGYLNILKDCDAGVQWALFMPEVVKNQQKGFNVKSFEYKKLHAMRFIGFEGGEYDDVCKRTAKMRELDSLNEYASEIKHDVLFIHHYGRGVDVDDGHAFWGRFYKKDTFVPEGFVYFDFTPVRSGGEGLPYISQFAYAVFEGDEDAIHSSDGFDGNAMYDVTRNIMLGQGVCIPYPDKYWTAEVFPDGCDKTSRAYMFSAEL